MMRTSRICTVQRTIGAVVLCFLLLLLTAPHPAHAFDRVSAGQRYRQWYAQLQSDLYDLVENVPRNRPVTREDVERWCARSVVPGSRAVPNLVEFLSVLPSLENGKQKRLSYPSALRLIMGVLDLSLPAGDGGLFPEAVGAPFPNKTLQVWYMHIDGGSLLQPYFADTNAFKPYHLPASGTLERDAYPFLLFEDGKNGLRFGGFGQEWWGAVSTLNNAQYF